MTLTFPQAIDRLNRYSRIKWGDKAPQYSYTWRGPTTMRTYYVHRQRAEVSPFMPADDLFARGPRDHCLAKVMSAIQFILSEQ